jgi:pimeloyl-ACP methyl ester carboxylesterase
MNYREFGATNGRIAIYLHGAPGAPEEGRILHAAALQHGLRVICPDRFVLPDALDGDSYFQQLARDMTAVAQGTPVDLIGFSIGAFVALQTCRFLPGQVRSLHLVSPAAPLQGGSFLPSMAGGAVFQLAAQSPHVFKLLAHGQGWLAAHMPQLLFPMLFRTATGGDRALASSGDFRLLMRELLATCFGPGMHGYLRDIQAYVAPWQSTLAGVNVTTHLWHGDQDNWAPIAMSHYLSEHLPGNPVLHVLKGQSHYSSLYACADQLCQQVAKTEL